MAAEPPETQHQDYFESAYRSYEAQNPPHKLDHYLDVLDATVQPGQLRLLDVGCGQGAFLARAARRHPDWKLRGIDINEQAATATSKRVPDAQVSVSDVNHLPHPSTSLDVVTAWDVLEHLENPDLALSAVHATLRKDGWLAFVVPVYDGLTSPVIRKLDRDPTHIHKWPRDRWLERTGSLFTDIEWHGIFRFLLPGRIYLHTPTRRLRQHTPAILVTARKPA